MAYEDHHHIFLWHFTILNHSNIQSYNSHALFLLLLFFIFLILITSSFLCAHFCRRCLSQPATASTAAMTSRLPDCEWVRVDHTKSSVHSLSTYKSFVDGGLKTTDCCICLSGFEECEKLKVLTECQHAYHSECLDRWINAQPTCPLCRASLQVNCEGKAGI